MKQEKKKKKILYKQDPYHARSQPVSSKQKHVKKASWESNTVSQSVLLMITPKGIEKKERF